MKLKTHVLSLLFMISSTVSTAAFQPPNFANIPPTGNPALRDAFDNFQDGYRASQDIRSQNLEIQRQQIEIEIMRRQLEQLKRNR